NSDLGIGFPQFYHKANIEAGGASPDRLFSYYAGFGGYNQDHRVIDQSNGSSLDSIWGTPVTNCGAAAAPTPALVPSCYSGGVFQPQFEALGPYVSGGTPDFSDRESVVNFHFAIPHHHDSGRDDFQVLYQNSDLKTFYADSGNDYGVPFLNATLGSLPCFVGGTACTSSRPRGLQYNGGLGQTFDLAGLAGQQSQVVPYFFPSSNGQANIPLTQRDAIDNAVGIVKVQYQKNFGSDAYLRVYGYTLFSDWFNYGPNTNWQAFAGAPGFGPPFDYELTAHARGVSATFAKQFGSKNLVNLQGSYVTATSLRDNNTQMYRRSTVAAVAVSSANPTNGVCYDATGAPTGCSATEGGSPVSATLDQLYAPNGRFGTISPLPASCGGSACTFLTVDNGLHATYNTVTPKFGSGSITDEWDPTDRLHINLGLRYDTFDFGVQNTLTGVRNFWFNAWNASQCYDTNNRIAGVKSLAAPIAGGATTAACQAAFGSTFAPATISPVSQNLSFHVIQPRFGVTYTLNPQNVLRFSYGKYDQAPNTAYEQYNTLQQNLPAIFAQGTLGGFNLFGYGRNQPTFPIRPEISFNTDLSLEHQFKGTDMSFKLTPFYRKTQDQIEQFFLDVNTNFVSGLNVGSQTSKGVEFQFQKGDFSRNGLSGLLSYTYTDAKIKYSPVVGNSSILDTVNQNIIGYNAYT
ncbi:MAG: TonB-dependent receptor, partial [Candidatus Eremiobacteraeota bacterium]|nr:TonB-dependent receptor [Candidatus Eremiobacteraeota bacterium]